MPYFTLEKTNNNLFILKSILCFSYEEQAVEPGKSALTLYRTILSFVTELFYVSPMPLNR